MTGDGRSVHGGSRELTDPLNVDLSHIDGIDRQSFENQLHNDLNGDTVVIAGVKRMSETGDNFSSFRRRRKTSLRDQNPAESIYQSGLNGEGGMGGQKPRGQQMHPATLSNKSKHSRVHPHSSQFSSDTVSSLPGISSSRKSEGAQGQGYGVAKPSRIHRKFDDFLQKSDLNKAFQNKMKE